MNGLRGADIAPGGKPRQPAIAVHCGDRDEALPGVEPRQFFTCGRAAA
jgi:hypothetical protein